MEELVAELGAAFLCADLQITDEPRADHAQYLASWLSIMKEDKKAIFTAASKASEAAAYLTGFQSDGARCEAAFGRPIMADRVRFEICMPIAFEADSSILEPMLINFDNVVIPILKSCSRDQQHWARKID